ncbi:MAG TPA: pyridoxamine 5'-phosphate oxidase family protein [Pyrinomonadaceae bacterium]|nr:pyridoxamine 5'-phosphate oxidase family protein [Pyrinomonadaceae bacterium]
MIEQLNNIEAGDLLEKGKFGHLACVLENGEPYLVPINYLYFEGAIYVHTLPGKKLEAMRLNGKVCLQVEKIKDDYRWQSVIVFGEFQELQETEEKIKILQAFCQRFEHLTPVEAMNEENWSISGIVIFRINIKKITGITER